MVKKHADDTSNCTMTWKCHIVEQNVRCWGKEKELLWHWPFKDKKLTLIVF